MLFVGQVKKHPFCFQQALITLLLFKLIFETEIKQESQAIPKC